MLQNMIEPAHRNRIQKIIELDKDFHLSLSSLVSPSGMVETPRLQAKFLFAIGLTTLSLLPPAYRQAGLRGEGWDGGDEGSSLSTPTLTLPHLFRGRGF